MVIFFGCFIFGGFCSLSVDVEESVECVLFVAPDEDFTALLLLLPGWLEGSSAEGNRIKSDS